MERNLFDGREAAAAAYDASTGWSGGTKMGGGAHSA